MSAPASAENEVTPEGETSFSGLLDNAVPGQTVTETQETDLDHDLGNITDEDRVAAEMLTEADLGTADARLVELVSTATKSVTTVRAVPTPPPSLSKGSGAASMLRNGWIPSYGCWRLTVTMEWKNLFGNTLFSATQTLRNVCRSGSTFSPTPTSQRSYTAAWGYQHCGWNADYAGWVSGTTVYGAGGQARFAFGGLCWGPNRFIGVEIHANASSGIWNSWTY